MNNLPKPKSAPGMKSKVLQSKFVRAKSDRAKEIEDWAKQGRKNIEVIRQSGGLSENITEDLMLHEKLMELSKSRYKFIANNKFEQKMFLQRQMKKSAALREALQDVNIDKNIPKWATEAPKTRDIQPKEPPQPPVPVKDTSPSPVKPEPPAPARKILREKPESAPARRRAHATEGESPPPRPQTRASYSIESRITSAGTENNFFQTQPKIVTKKRYNASEASKSVVTFSEPPKTAPSQISNKVLPRRASIRRGSMHKQAIASWARKSYKVKVDDQRGPLRDSRYTDLESSLCQVYHGNPKAPEVDKIISVFGALNTPSSRPMESRRPKMTNKIKEFLSQTGITLNV